MSHDVEVRRIDRSEGPILRQLRLRSLADAPDAFGQPLDEALARPEAEWAHIATAAAGGDQRAWFLAFVVVERRTAEPMLPFEIFRRRNFAAANVETFLVYGALYGVFVYLTIYIQALGFTPFEAGLIQIPTSVVMILLAARFGVRW